MIYGRIKGRDAWHWWRNCSSVRWHRLRSFFSGATMDLVEAPTGERPRSGELCDECFSKERRGVGVPLERPA